MSWLDRIDFRIRTLFGKKKLDADMNEELRLHLDLLAERYREVGLTPEEANHAARRAFGGVEQIKERAREIRGTLWLEQAMQDLRFAVRQLAKAPVFTLAAVLSLAIGIGLNTAVFSIINTLFYQTIRGVPEPKRVLIFNEGDVSPDGFHQLKEQSAEVATITAASSAPIVVRIGEFERRDRTALVAGNYFDVLKVKAAVGRLFSAESDSLEENIPPVAVVSHSFWKNYLGGKPDIIGASAKLNDAVFTIVGIAEPDFHGPGPEGPPLWVPFKYAALIERSPGRRLQLLGRLNPGVSLSAAQAAIDVIVARSPLVFGERTHLRLSAGREDWRGGMSPEKRVEFLLVTTVPLIVVAGLLWIACSNVGNLLLARAVQRQKEIAIRVASGASRARLMRMLMGESLLLAVLGGVAGIGVARLTIDFVFSTLSNFSAFSVQIDSRVLCYTLAVSVVASLFFGLAPALQASRTDVNSALKGESSDPALRSTRLRSLFLASQIASSLAVLIVAGTFIKSLVASAYVGAQAKLIDHLVFVELPVLDRTAPEREGFYQAAREKTLTAFGVESATLLEQGNTPQVRFSKPGEPVPAENEPASKVGLQRIDASFFKTVGLGVQRGRALSQLASGAPLQEAVINEAMARQFWSIELAVGQRFQLDGKLYETIGVVSDGTTNPMVYTQRPVDGVERFGLLVRTRGSAKNHTAAISSALRELANPGEIPIVTPFREVAFRWLTEITSVAVLIGALALSLAAAGIYASVAFSTGQRTREIGIRMALGATRSSVLRLILGNGLRVVAYGSVVGLIFALIGVRLLSGMMLGHQVIDLIAVACVLLVFAVVAVSACLLPAYRATRVSPMVPLRYE